MILRPVYILGSLYLVISAATLLPRARRPATTANRASPAATGAEITTARGWFQAMKPYCNAVEVEAWHRWQPPPSGQDGIAYSAACYALAGKVDHARSLILGLPARDRWRAAGIVFDVAHPVADAGDDRSAGPIMEMVVEFWPNHYMALYHAGMAAYGLGEHARAKTHLQRFIDHYDQDDGWRSNALTVLKRLEAD